MPNKVTKRLIDEIDIVAGATVTRDLPKALDYRSLNLRQELTLTTAGGTTNPDYTSTDADKFGIISAVEIIANGRDVIKRLTGQQMFIMSWLKEHSQGKFVRPTIAGGGAADYLIRTNARLHFIEPYGRNPLDGLFASIGLSSLQIRITFGAIADVVTGGDRTVTIKSGSKIYITSEESYGQTAEEAANRFLNKEYSFSQEVVSANQKIQVRLPIGNIIPRIVLGCRDAAALSDSILSDVKLYFGTEVFYNLRAADIQALNKLEAEIESEAQTGIYQLLTTPDMLLTEALDATSLSELILEMTASKGSGATNINITVQEMVPPKQEKAA